MGFIETVAADQACLDGAGALCKFRLNLPRTLFNLDSTSWIRSFVPREFCESCCQVNFAPTYTHYSHDLHRAVRCRMTYPKSHGDRNRCKAPTVNGTTWDWIKLTVNVQSRLSLRLPLLFKRYISWYLTLVKNCPLKQGSMLSRVLPGLQTSARPLLAH